MTTRESADGTNQPTTAPQRRHSLRLHPLVAVLMLVGTLACLWLTGVLRGNTDLRSIAAGVVPPVGAVFIGLVIATVAALLCKKSNKVFNFTLAACMIAFLSFLGWAAARRAANTEIAHRNAADERRAANAGDRSSQRFSQLVIASAEQFRADTDAFMAAGAVSPNGLTTPAEVAARLSLAKAMQSSHLRGCSLISDAETVYASLLREEGCPEDGIGPLTAAFRRGFDRREPMLQCEVRTRAITSMVAFLQFLSDKAEVFELDNGQYMFDAESDFTEFERLRLQMVEAAQAERDYIKARSEREGQR